MNSHFTHAVELIPFGRNRWHVGESFSFWTRRTGLIIVPRGFKTDLASVPNLGAVGATIMLASAALARAFYCDLFFIPLFIGFLVSVAGVWIKPYGLWSRAAVVHDFLYATKLFDKGLCDWVLAEGMRVSGASNVEVRIFFCAVSVFGWFRWLSSKKVSLRNLR